MITKLYTLWYIIKYKNSIIEIIINNNNLLPVYIRCDNSCCTFTLLSTVRSHQTNCFIYDNLQINTRQ